jgi:hypothetical protein
MGYSAFVACFLIVPLMPFQPSAGNLAPTIPVVGANFVWSCCSRNLKRAEAIDGGPESKPRGVLQFTPNLRRTAAPLGSVGS